jgi:hypothetical protein
MLLLVTTTGNSGYLKELPVTVTGNEKLNIKKRAA